MLLKYVYPYIYPVDKSEDSKPLKKMMETAAFKRACEEGMAHYRYARIMVTGKYSDGKTSLIQALLGKPIPETHIPTDGCDTKFSCKVDITKCTEDWSELLIKKKNMVDERVTRAIIKHAQEKHTPDNITKPEQGKPPAKRRKISSADELKKEHVSLEPTDLRKEDDKQLYEKVNQKKDEKVMEKLEVEAVIFIWDFGGQEVYTNLHPIFLRSDCVHIIVYDLEKLENAESKEEWKNYSDEVEFWIQMIQSNNEKQDDAEKQPNVLLVGTHKDKLQGLNAEEQEKQAIKLEQNLQDKLTGKQYKYLIADFFHVDSKGGVRGDTENFKKLKKSLIKLIKVCPTWETERPIPYMRLLSRLYEQEEKPALLRYEDVKKDALQYNIKSNEDVKQFLSFHHSTGDLTYLSDSTMKDFVIVNAQWLVNVFTKIITIDKYYAQGTVANQKDLDQLKKDGLIRKQGKHGSLLADLWKEFLHGVQEEKNASVEYLTKLMCEFDLMMEQGDQYYQVPCLLKEHANLEQLETDNPTIYLQFHATRESHEDFLQGNTISDHFLPPALFHQLRCRLATCRSLPWRRDPKLNQRNRFRLKVGDQQIILSSQSTWIRLSVKDKTGAANILENLRAQLDQILRNCYSNMWYEFYVNPCQETEEGALECITSSGHSSIDGSDVNLIEATCEIHDKSLKTSEYDFWFVQEKTGAMFQAG